MRYIIGCLPLWYRFTQIRDVDLRTLNLLSFGANTWRSAHGERLYL